MGACKKRVAIAVVLLVGLFGLIPGGVLARQAKAEESVSALLAMQAEAWNNGDLDKFMTGYLSSPDTSYTSGGAVVWGYEALRERYQKKYGVNHEGMGKLAFSDLRIFDLGASNALCIGHWNLERAGQATVQGVFSLTLVKIGAGWKIMHDHTSVEEKKT
jgi:ketosteroid isomerase-like protein